MTNEQSLAMTMAFRAISQELHRAWTGFPRSAASEHEAFAVLLEEVDELWDAVKLNQKSIGRATLIQREAIQVAAMAIRLIAECVPIQN